jgi:hypothetical protein
MKRDIPRRAATAAAVAALAAFTPATSAASQGVAVDIGRIAIDQKLTPGGGYRLPVIGVRNPGTERTTYRMGASAIQGAEAPPEGWFDFSPRTFTLKPGETKPVRVRLTLPANAEPNEYTALVGAQIAGGRGVRVGAAAAARTTFTVEPANFLQARWLELKRFFGDNRPWTWLAPALLAFAAASSFVRKRFRFSVARRA